MNPRFLLASMVVSFPLAVAAAGPSARAVLKNADGAEIGTATFRPTKGGVRVRVVVTQGIPAGKHGIHIHAVGKCDAPDFASAGGHFNPTGKKHGLHNPEGAHVGDLPNLVVSKAGKAKASFIAHGATFGEGATSLFSADGTALVIHAGPDDEMTDPAGNSGARIACGVIEKD